MSYSKEFSTKVLVVGGGMAGVAAAVASARNGMKTMLVESQGSLGGLATNGLVTGVAGMVEGICMEFLESMNEEGALYSRPHCPAFDPEKGKIILERMLLKAGVKVLYWTYSIDTMVDAERINHVICHSKSGRIKISAEIVIDTTGDADVSASAGVPYEAGSADFNGYNMSTTLAFRMANADMIEYESAMAEWRSGQKEPVSISIIADLEEEAVRNGDLPYFIFPTALIYRVSQTPENDSDITVMTAHSFKTHNLDVEDLTRQTIEQHEQIMLLEKFFRKYVPGFERSRIAGIASMHGVRDSRRITGEYVLKDEDVACANKFDDGIAKFPEFFDTHHPTSAKIGFMRHIHLDRPKGKAVCRPAQCSNEMHP
ncbi:MAG: FAD-dependent oxidoreductase, partial [Deltaproteobacteria bacterium]|nr:FAD-dependent oxidoreductase [Deltaproteobacteria bacterium]